jgi:hypothetical protein
VHPVPESCAYTPPWYAPIPLFNDCFCSVTCNVTLRCVMELAHALLLGTFQHLTTYSGVTEVLPKCYRSVTVLLQ